MTAKVGNVGQWPGRQDRGMVVRKSKRSGSYHNKWTSILLYLNDETCGGVLFDLVGRTIGFWPGHFSQRLYHQQEIEPIAEQGTYVCHVWCGLTPLLEFERVWTARQEHSHRCPGADRKKEILLPGCG